MRCPNIRQACPISAVSQRRGSEGIALHRVKFLSFRVALRKPFTILLCILILAHAVTAYYSSTVDQGCSPNPARKLQPWRPRFAYVSSAELCMILKEPAWSAGDWCKT
ncbi:hypothetical protein TRVL_08010 [Trypanosoma vivax]|nr:hypothetical protein TRVL_08010 [Trypanosoma vivax]